MARALSLDLRERVNAAMEGGTTCGKTEERLSVGVATVTRWHARVRAEGEISAKPMGADRHSHRPEAHSAAILKAYETRPQIHLCEVRDVPSERGATARLSGLFRFFRRHAITCKKGICTPPSRTGPT